MTTPPADAVFAAEAEGLDVLRTRGGVCTPDVLHAGRARLGETSDTGVALP